LFVGAIQKVRDIVSPKLFFSFLNTTFNAFGSKKSCLTALKGTFFLVHSRHTSHTRLAGGGEQEVVGHGRRT